MVNSDSQHNKIHIKRSIPLFYSIIYSEIHKKIFQEKCAKNCIEFCRKTKTRQSRALNAHSIGSNCVRVVLLCWCTRQKLHFMRTPNQIVIQDFLHSLSFSSWCIRWVLPMQSSMWTIQSTGTEHFYCFFTHVIWLCARYFVSMQHLLKCTHIATE